MSDMLLVLDTNVWLDYELGFRDGHTAAYELVDFALRNNVRLGMASHSMKDAFYIITQQFKALSREAGTADEESISAAAFQTAWGIFDHLMQVSEYIAVDYSDAWIAAKYRNLHRDYEDNLVVAAVMRAHADLLVTSDAKLIHHSPVPTVFPTDALEIIRVNHVNPN